MNQDLSRRVARIIGIIVMEISLEERSAFMDRLEQAGSFSELQEADQRAILAADSIRSGLPNCPNTIIGRTIKRDGDLF